MARHVTAEVRTVYRSARGVKLTKHAAYIAAAKKLIADRCSRWDDEREAAVTATDHNGDTVVSEGYWPCTKDGPYHCRFHTWPVTDTVYVGHGEYIERTVPEVAYYRRVLDRLVRFLKYVDGKAKG